MAGYDRSLCAVSNGVAARPLRYLRELRRSQQRTTGTCKRLRNRRERNAQCGNGSRGMQVATSGRSIDPEDRAAACPRLMRANAGTNAGARCTRPVSLAACSPEVMCGLSPMSVPPTKHDSPPVSTIMRASGSACAATNASSSCRFTSRPIALRRWGRSTRMTATEVRDARS